MVLSECSGSYSDPREFRPDVRRIMSRQPSRVDDLLVSSNFIRAVRESGYLSISTALAELVDNSLQAAATQVAITITRPTIDALPEIVVEDNGVGMSKIRTGALPALRRILSLRCSPIFRTIRHGSPCRQPQPGKAGRGHGMAEQRT